MGHEDLRFGTYIPVIPPEDGVKKFTRNVDVWMTMHSASYNHSRYFNLLNSTGFVHQQV
jgi:hypothetical protein